MKLHHIALKTKSVQKLAEFYKNTLGLAELDCQTEPDGTVRSIWLQVGDMILMVELSQNAATQITPDISDFSKDTPAWHLVAFSIEPEELEGYLTRLNQAGVTIEHKTAHSVYFFDPDGNRLALSHYPNSKI